MRIDGICRVASGIGVVGYVCLVTRIVFTKHAVFRTNFDLSLYDQGVWLISRGQTPFSTVRGIHLLTDHFTPILYLLAPLYWIWNDARMLLLIQTLVLALGALLIYQLAHRSLTSAPMALCLSLCYLCYLPLLYVNFDEFHPIALSTTLLLAAFCFQQKQLLLPLGITLLLAMSCGEQIVVCVVLWGGYLFLTRSKRAGILALGLAIFWLILVSLHSHGSSEKAYMALYYGNRGHTLHQFLVYLLTHPREIWSILTSSSSLTYVRDLLFPLGFLPLLSPLSLIPAFPVWCLNMLSDWSGLRSITFHYTAPMIPFVWLSGLRGVVNLSSCLTMVFGRLLRTSSPDKRRNLSLAAVGSFLVLIPLGIWGTYLMASKDTTSEPTVTPSHQRVVERAMKTIPGQAVVSAQLSLVSHLTHRKEVYWFPNPFEKYRWGLTLSEIVPGKSLTPSELAACLPRHEVEWILLDTKTVFPPAAWQVSVLRQSKCYRPLLSEDGVWLFKRVGVNQHG